MSTNSVDSGTPTGCRAIKIKKPRRALGFNDELAVGVVDFDALDNVAPLRLASLGENVVDLTFTSVGLGGGNAAATASAIHNVLHMRISFLLLATTRLP